ncbi:uncharacterized protein PAEPH01_0259 [Pancytospora epiphaga]|nr:uncharacterized protein PAEPH01_0259 [Pancytospora epiphaga]
MINTLYLSIPNDLIAEYHSVFQENDDKKIFLFLRKYLRYIECDEGPYNRYFTLRDPVTTKKETKVFMKDFNAAVGKYLGHYMKHSNLSAKKSVKEGEVACYTGVGHEYGIFGMPLNPKMAFYFYTISAQLNCDIGTFRLAQCYERGLGTHKNLAKAVYFFRCAAKLGLTDGMHVYGMVLAHGYMGAPRDMELGLHFLSLASLKASRIYPYSLFDIGQWYENNSNDANIISDSEYSFEIYYKGTQLNDPNCMHRLGLAYQNGDFGRKVNQSKAFEFYRMAAKQGQIDAQLAVSEIYFNGVGARKKRSPDQSYFWALKAATKGSARAGFILGEYAVRGYGVKQNMLLSLWWFTIASSFGSEEASKKIVELKHEIEKKDSGPFVQPGCCSIFCQ